MPPIKFLYKTEKKAIMQKLEYYGITKLPYLLIESGKEKIRGYTGSLLMEEIHELNKQIGIDLIGLYLFHNYSDNLRLSFDAIYALKDQITKNIIEVNDEQAIEFLKGRDINLIEKDKERFKEQGETFGFKIIKYKDEFLGTCKLTEDRIINYMPKERRLR